MYLSRSVNESIQKAVTRIAHLDINASQERGDHVAMSKWIASPFKDVDSLQITHQTSQLTRHLGPPKSRPDMNFQNQPNDAMQTDRTSVTAIPLGCWLRGGPSRSISSTLTNATDVQRNKSNKQMVPSLLQQPSPSALPVTTLLVSRAQTNHWRLAYP
jgi:hypothetical protein